MPTLTLQLLIITLTLAVLIVLAVGIRRLMTIADTMNATLDRIDATTNTLAAEIRDLKNVILNLDGVNASDAAAVEARLEKVASTLDAIAAPDPVPAPAPTPGDGG